MVDVTKALNIVRRLSPSGFFSRAAEEAQRIPQAKGTPEQMRKMLLDRKGVKEDELKWTGLDEWLKGKKSVTREEIADFLNKNQVRVDEKVLGADSASSAKAVNLARERWVNDAAAIRAEQAGDIDNRRDFANASPDVRAWHLEEALKEFNENALDNSFIENLMPRSFGNNARAKFEQYTLPGGEYYRELLLTRPEVNPDATPRFSVREGSGMRRVDADNYRSPHWDEPNVLAHMRMQERVDPEGRRVLHLEELQSDWAQEGRKRGFQQPQFTVRNKDMTGGGMSFPTKEEADNYLANMAAEYRNDFRIVPETSSNGVPQGPFVESTPGWTNLALKRAMIEAARGNFDAIAWTPGAEQVKRYDLSKRIKRIYALPYDDGTYEIGTKLPGGAEFHQASGRMSLDKIEQTFGKEIAERIKSGQFSGTEGNVSFLEGDNLRAGGKGMIGYYDKILPTQISKVLKDIGETPQFGNVSITRGNVGATGDDIMKALPETRDMNEAQRSAWWQSLDPQRRDQLFADYRAGSMELPSFNITPEMREKIKQGLPLFTMLPAAVGLGTTASQMVEGQNPAEEPQGFAGGGHVGEALRLIQDKYPTHYLPNVGRQVMADGGEPTAQGRRRAALEELGAFEDRPVMNPETMGQNWAAAVERFRRTPLREGETVARPFTPSVRDQIGQAIAGDDRLSHAGEIRGRTADLLVGSRGTPGSGTLGFGVLDVPMVTGIPLQASDVSDAASKGDYLGAALGTALPAAFYARKPIMSAGRAVYDAGRRAVEVAGDVLGRVPAPVAAGAAGAAAMAPEEAEAGKADLIARAARKVASSAPAGGDVQRALEVAGGKSSRPYRSPTQQVDATLGQPSENVLFRGKDPANWTPQDWHDFGKQYGVSNLGPANQKEWEKGLVPYRTISGREITLPPGGYASDEPFTYYDLLHLKSQGINPNDLPPDVHQAIHNRMVRSMQPGPEGPTNEQITNQMIFGLISPNQPLTPNELALQRAMVKGPQDVEAWGRMIPYRYTGEIPPVSERQAISREITPRLGLHAAERGGIGASGSANYTDIAEFVQKMRDKPNFYRFNPNDPSFEGMSDAEKWATHVGRVMNATRGLKAKTGSLASVWQSPETAAISAIDRHMATKFRGDMFPSTDAKAAWEANVVAKYNEARPDAAVRSIDEMLAAPGGRGHFVDSALAYVNNLPAAVTRSARTGEYNPSIPVGLRDLDWPGGEPRKMEMVAGPYVRALEANAEEARRAGQGLFSNQWMLWDRIRNRLEPHEILFPGLEKLPRMSLEQMRRVTKDLSEAGYMAAEGGVRPLPSASRAGYFTIPPILAGGAALLSPEEAAAAEAGLPPERRDGGAVAKHAIMLAKEIGSSPRETTTP